MKRLNLFKYGLTALMMAFAMLMIISCSDSDTEVVTDTPSNENSLLGQWKWVESINYDENDSIIARNYHGGYGWNLFFAPNNYLIQFSGERPEHNGSYEINKNGVYIKIENENSKLDDDYRHEYIINSFDGENLELKEKWAHVDDDDKIQQSTDYIIHRFQLVYHYKDNKPNLKDANKIGRWKSENSFYSISCPYYYVVSKVQYTDYKPVECCYYELKDDGTLWVSTNDKFSNNGGYYEYIGTWSCDWENNVMLFNAFTIDKIITWKITSNFDDYWTGETMDGNKKWTFQRVTTL